MEKQGKVSKASARKQKLNSDASKSDIISLLEHEIFEDVVNKFAREQTWVKLLKIFVYFLTAVFAIAGFYLAWQSNMENNKAAEIRAEQESRNLQLTEQIKYKITFWREITDAIIQMRKTREYIVLRCQFGMPYTAYEQNRLRFEASYNTVKVITGTNRIFNQEVYEKLRQLVEFDKSVADVCAANAPSDEKWENYLHQIDSLIGKSIEEDQVKLGTN